MKSNQTIIRKNLMEQLNFITNLLDIKDPNIQIMDVVNRDAHKEIIAKLDYEAPSCPNCGSQMKKYDFQKLNIITVLEGKTQAIIRNHFLRHNRAVRCQVKIITMDMFSPYYDLAKQLRFRISKLRLKQSPRPFHSQTLKSF